MKGFGKKTKKNNKTTRVDSLNLEEKLISDAFSYHSEGNLSAAESVYIKYMQKGFHDPRVLSNLAVIYKQTGRLKEALNLFKKVINLYPNHADAYANLGNLLKDAGELEEAELVTRRAIELQPDFVNAIFNLGGILKDQGKLEEAEIITKRAIELQPDLLNAYLNLGLILNERCNYSEAEDVLSIAINLAPNIAKPFLSLASIYQNQGKLKEAEELLLKSIEIEPRSVIAYQALAATLSDQDKLDDAELSIRKAISLDANFASSYLSLALILRGKNHLEDAEIEIRKAIKIAPDQAENYLNLGIILHDQGNFVDAIIATNKAIELDPTYGLAFSNLGGHLFNLGELSDAENASRRAIELLPDNSDAYYNLAGILQNQGAFDKAQHNYRTAIEINQYSGRSFFALSRYNDYIGDDDLEDKLFNIDLEKVKSKQDKVSILFARSNFMHRAKMYKESAQLLKSANDLKLSLYNSDADNILSITNKYLLESQQILPSEDPNIEIEKNVIFIVGMPRSGSTLVESIVSLNPDVFPLDETSIFEESFTEWRSSLRNKSCYSLADFYQNRLLLRSPNFRYFTDKNLYNFCYVGFIASYIPNAKIIHCYRNPLDNILSLYRANLASGSSFSSSIIDSTRVLIRQRQVMDEYSSLYPSFIYNLNYDDLVSDPENQIPLLINWLGWSWDHAYLSPHLNTRGIKTASNIQARSPIHSKSIGGWKKYESLLDSAKELLIHNSNFLNP